MNEASLDQHLREHGIDTSQWGIGEAKTLRHLAQELTSGEATLIEQDGHLVRKITVLGVNVFAKRNGREHRLREDHQEFNDGRVRRRSLTTSISEKVKPGEPLLKALARALEEELGISRYQIVSSLELKQGSQPHPSPSFPGLLTEYQTIEVDVLIDPSEYRNGYTEHQEDKETYFVWDTIL